ncbi:MAG: signal peptidase I [Bacilli bacterium]|nr:signal peptidase I [Bacilli bacterium]
MKKSYIKMLIFQAAILLVLILNSFVSNILKGYNIVLFLLLSIILFKIFFGIERDRHRYTKDVFLDLFIFLLAFFMLYYIFGLVIGLARTDNYYTFLGFKNFVIPITLVIILKEFLRYAMLQRTHDSKLLIVITYLIFLLLDVSDAIYYNDFSSGYDVFIFIALSLLPAITANLACTYISRKTGYKPIILYLLVTRLYLYLLPIVPDPNEYIVSIINLILPIVWLYRVYVFFDKEKDEHLTRKYNKKSVLGILIPSVVIVVLVYFTSGYFRYYAVAIASGSMSPAINKGDIVVVEKIEDRYERLEEGQVLAFRYNNIVIVHRIIDIVETDGEYFFYTKGDANNNEDDYAIEQSDVVGVVRFRIPYAGLPTVWLNE